MNIRYEGLFAGNSVTTHAEGGISSRLGNPLSSLQTGRPQHRHPISPSAIFSLELTDSAWLHTRIAQRFDAMLAAAQALMENKP